MQGYVRIGRLHIMFIYIVLYLLLLLCSLTDVSRYSRKNKKILLIFLVIIFVLFRGLRWETGTDWDQFEYCFNHAEWNNITSYDRYGNGQERMEAGYMLLNRVIKIFGNYTLFLLLTNLFLVGTWAKLAYNFVPSKPMMTFAMIMISNMFFPVRLQLAAGFFCWSLYFLTQKRYILCILIALLTCTIHKSAILIVPLLFILPKKINSKIALSIILLTPFSDKISETLSLILVGAAVLIYPVYPDLAVNMANYSDMEIAGAREVSFFSQFISFCFALFLISFYLYARHLLSLYELPREDEKERTFNIFFNSFFIFTFANKFFSIPSLANFQRISEYFTVGYAVCFMLSYEILKHRISQKYLLAFYILFYLYKLRGLLNTPYPDEMYPYISIFNLYNR